MATKSYGHWASPGKDGTCVVMMDDKQFCGAPLTPGQKSCQCPRLSAPKSAGTVGRAEMKRLAGQRRPQSMAAAVRECGCPCHHSGPPCSRCQHDECPVAERLGTRG